MRSRKTNAGIIGAIYGLKIKYKSLVFEPFTSLGLGLAVSQSEITYITSKYGYSFSHNTLPYSEINAKLEFYGGIGLKIGFGFAKSNELAEYENVINELNEDVLKLNRIVANLKSNYQISEWAQDNFKRKIKELENLAENSIRNKVLILDFTFRIDEKIGEIVTFLKLHTLKVDSYNSVVYYQKPNGKILKIQPFKEDIYEFKERISNYADFVLSENEKAKYFKNFIKN